MPSNSGHPLPFSQRMFYSIGHVLNDLTASMWFSYFIIYYHQVKLFNNTLAGYLMLIGQVSDALFTPFIGYESDRTNGIRKLGKRKTWHFIGTICVACSYPFLFNDCITCKSSPDLAKFFYFAPFVVIFQFGWASTQISHLSLIPELTSDTDERVGLNGLRYAFTVISNITVFGIAWMLFYLNTSSHKDSSMLTSSDSPQFRDLVFIVIGIGLFFSFLFHIGVKEPVKEDGTDAENKSLLKSCKSATSIEISTVKHSYMTWKDWLKEKQFFQVAVVYMCTRLYVNVSQIYLPLYVTETLKLPKENVAVMPLVVYISGFVSSLVMKPANKTIGRKATYFVGQLLGIGGVIWLYFLSGNSDTTKYMAYGGSVLIGLGGSSMLVTSLAMTSDLIGENTESGAFVYGAMSFTDKLSNGIAVLVIQQLHPCSSCCPQCNEYFRTVLTFVPGSVVILGFLMLLTLLPTQIGVRRKNIVKQLKDINSTSGSDRIPDAVCTNSYTSGYSSADSSNESQSIMTSNRSSINT